MKRKKMEKLSLTFGSILISLLIGITVVVAFRYSGVSIKPRILDDNLQQADDTAFGEKPGAFVPAKMPSTGLSDVSRPAKVFKEKSTFSSHGNNGERYAHSIQGMDAGENTPGEVEGRRYNRAHTIQSMGTKGESPVTAGSAGLTSRLADYYISEKDYSVSPEPGDDDYGLDTADQNDNNESNYNVSISRGFISGSFDAGEMDVILTLSVGNNPPNGLLIKEYIPEEWGVQQSAPAYESFNPSSGEIKWLFIGSDVESMEIAYKIVKNESFASGKSFRGLFLYNDPAGEHMTMQIEGKQDIGLF